MEKNKMKKEYEDIDMDGLKNEFNQNTPFPHLILKNWFSDKIMDNTLSNILKIKDDYDWHKLCTNTSDFSQFGESAVQLTNYLISDEWVNFLRELTDIKNLRPDKDWVGGGINYEPRGSHLEPHTDFNKSSSGWRRVNLLLFLSKNWKKEWGGYNEMGHFDGGRFVKDVSYSPDFNTAVIFSTSDNSFHGFDIVKCPDNEARIVITCYYYSDDQGPHSIIQPNTKYIGWDKERKNKEEYLGRTGTGWRKIK